MRSCIAIVVRSAFLLACIAEIILNANEAGRLCGMGVEEESFVDQQEYRQIPEDMQYTATFGADKEKHAEERKRKYVSPMTLHAPKRTDMSCICI